MTTKRADTTTYAVVEIDQGNRLRRVVGRGMTLPEARRRQGAEPTRDDRRVWCDACLDATVNQHERRDETEQW